MTSDVPSSILGRGSLMWVQIFTEFPQPCLLRKTWFSCIIQWKKNNYGSKTGHGGTRQTLDKFENPKKVKGTVGGKRKIENYYYYIHINPNGQPDPIQNTPILTMD